MNMRGCILVILMTSIPLRAFIYEVKVLRIGNESTNGYRYFIGCCDFHDKTHPANIKQRELIESLLMEGNTHDTKVLVEDLSSPNCHGRSSCGPFYIHSKAGILAGLHMFCKEKKIDCSNAEYRYCRVATMGPVINNLSVNPSLFPSTRTMTIGALLDEIEGIITDLKACTHTDYLKTMYTEDVKKIRSVFDKLHLTTHRNVSIADYLHASSTPKNKLDVVKHLLTFDSGLLDIKMAYLAFNARDKKRVIAFAGGTHINRVCDILKKMGYQQVNATSTIYKKEHDISKCLGSNIVDGAFCIKPEPLSLPVLEKYLKNQ